MNTNGLSVGRSRKSLEEKGFIHVEYVYDESGNINKPPIITILDPWEANLEFVKGGMSERQGGGRETTGAGRVATPNKNPITRTLEEEKIIAENSDEFSATIKTPYIGDVPSADPSFSSADEIKPAENETGEIINPSSSPAVEKLTAENENGSLNKALV